MKSQNNSSFKRKTQFMKSLDNSSFTCSCSSTKSSNIRFIFRFNDCAAVDGKRRNSPATNSPKFVVLRQHAKSVNCCIFEVWRWIAWARYWRWRWCSSFSLFSLPECDCRWRFIASHWSARHTIHGVVIVIAYFTIVRWLHWEKNRIRTLLKFQIHWVIASIVFTKKTK